MTVPPSVFREVKETLYQHWKAVWASTTAYCFVGDKFEPPADSAPWCEVSVQARTSGPGTIGGQGHRRIDRSGAVFIRFRVEPGTGDGLLTDLADAGRKVFESKRFDLNDIRFSTGDIGDAADVDGGRWRGVTAEIRFDYEDWN